jgi:hypothetical protein
MKYSKTCFVCKENLIYRPNYGDKCINMINCKHHCIVIQFHNTNKLKYFGIINHDKGYHLIIDHLQIILTSSRSILLELLNEEYKVIENFDLNNLEKLYTKFINKYENLKCFR